MVWAVGTTLELTQSGNHSLCSVPHSRDFSRCFPAPHLREAPRLPHPPFRSLNSHTPPPVFFSLSPFFSVSPFRLRSHSLLSSCSLLFFLGSITSLCLSGLFRSSPAPAVSLSSTWRPGGYRRQLPLPTGSRELPPGSGRAGSFPSAPGSWGGSCWGLGACPWIWDPGASPTSALELGAMELFLWSWELGSFSSQFSLGFGILELLLPVQLWNWEPGSFSFGSGSQRTPVDLGAGLFPLPVQLGAWSFSQFRSSMPRDLGGAVGIRAGREPQIPGSWQVGEAIPWLPFPGGGCVPPCAAPGCPDGILTDFLDFVPAPD